MSRHMPFANVDKIDILMKRVFNIVSVTFSFSYMYGIWLVPTPRGEVDS
jgi:hypothetical protein